MFNLKSNRKGFTLIEILIVVAIIGILASIALVGLGGAREKARDSKRIAEIRQVQSALELYFTRCNIYPGDADCSAANDPATWDDLVAVLADPRTNVKIPSKDPGQQPYLYGVNANNTEYVIGTELENDNAVLRDDVDGTVFNVDCDDSDTKFTYCVQF